MLKSVRNLIFQTYFRLTRSMTLGVRVAAIDDDGKICLIKHTYIDGWHLPGGGVESGESIYDAAIKELEEEAGLVTQKQHLHLLSAHTNFVNFKGDHVFLFKTQSFDKIPTNRPHEIAEIGFFTREELPKDTTRATMERINEIFENQIHSETW